MNIVFSVFVRCLNPHVALPQFAACMAAFEVWFILVLLLRYSYPLDFDGAEPMQGFFYIGHLPDMAEYNQHRWQYELRFLLPYCIASVILTLICLFVAAKLSTLITRRHNIWVYSVTSLVLMLTVAGASDVINVMWLKGGVFYAGEFESYKRLLIVSLPLAIISALVAFGVEYSTGRVIDDKAPYHAISKGAHLCGKL